MRGRGEGGGKGLLLTTGITLLVERRASLILSEIQPTDDELLVADLNFDTSINIQDIILLVNIILE